MPLLLLRVTTCNSGDPIPKAACHPSSGPRKEKKLSIRPIPGGSKASTILRMCIQLSQRTHRASATFSGTMGRPCLAGRDWEGSRGRGVHSTRAPSGVGEESSLCHQQGAPGRGSLAYGVSNFLVTSGSVLAPSRAGAEKEPVPNHSPLPAPSGRIILLYADELITVSSIWLLYIKKKNASSSHCVNSHPRAYHFATRVYYYLKTSF